MLIGSPVITRVTLQCGGEWMIFSLNDVGPIRCLYRRKKSSPLRDVPKNIKMNFRYITKLNVKVNILEENIGELLYNFDINKDLLNRTKNTLSITKTSVRSFY